MEETKDEIIKKTKNYLPAIIFGFIGMDFFAPVFFKLIAGQFPNPENIAKIFIAFKLFYYLLPLTLLLLWYYSNISYFKQYIIKYKSKPIFDLYSILILSTIVSVFYTTYEIVNQDWKIFIALLVPLAASIISVIYVIEVKKNIVNYNDLSIVALSAVLLILGLAILSYNFTENFFLKSNKNVNIDKSFYCNAFNSQKFINKLNNISGSLDSQSYNLKTKLLLADFSLLIDSTQKDTPKNSAFISPKLMNQKTYILNDLNDSCLMDSSYYHLLSNVNNEVHMFIGSITSSKDTQLTIIQAKQLKANAEYGQKLIERFKTGIEIIRFQLHNKAKNEYKYILEIVRGKGLMIIAVIILVLIACYYIASTEKKQPADNKNNKEDNINKPDKTPDLLRNITFVIAIYILMFIQLFQPVKTEHIDLNQPTWPLSLPNWYIPTYFHEVIHVPYYIDRPLSPNHPINFKTENNTNNMDKYIINFNDNINNITNQLKNDEKRNETTRNQIKELHDHYLPKKNNQ